MATRSRPRPLRVVIDTNVLLSTLVFKSGAMVAIKQACQSGECVPVISRATAEELLTVLRYPKLELDPEQQNAVLVEYLPYCEPQAEPKTRIKLPPCRDEGDQAFLLLAAASKADVLATGDKDVLALSGAVPFEILTPREFLRRLAQRGT